jgi:hypothetical protein
MYAQRATTNNLLGYVHRNAPAPIHMHFQIPWKIAGKRNILLGYVHRSAPIHVHYLIPCQNSQCS